MIIYVIIYHIRNNKNYSIDISIKYNTIISTVYKQYINNYINFRRGRRRKKKRMYNNYSIYREYIMICSAVNKRKEIALYKYILLNPAIREKEKSILYIIV